MSSITVERIIGPVSLNTTLKYVVTLAILCVVSVSLALLLTASLGWVNVIIRCEDREYRERLARKAYESFLKYYTWEKRAQKVLNGIKL